MPTSDFITLVDWKVIDPNNAIADRTSANTVVGDKYLAVGDFKTLELTFASGVSLHNSANVNVEFNPSLWCDEDRYGQWEFDPAGAKLQPCSLPASSVYFVNYGPAEVAALIAAPRIMSKSNINKAEEHFPFQDVEFQLDANPNIYTIRYSFFVTMETYNKYLFNEPYFNRRRLQFPRHDLPAVTPPFTNPLGKGSMYTTGAFFGLYTNVKVDGAVKTGLKLTNQTDITLNDTLLIEAVDGDDFSAQGWGSLTNTKVFVEFYPYPDVTFGASLEAQEEVQLIRLQLDLETVSVTSSSMTAKFDTGAGYTNVLDSALDGKEFYGRIYTLDSSGLDFEYGNEAILEDCQYDYIPARGWFWNEGITLDPNLIIEDSASVVVTEIPTGAPFTLKFDVVAGIQPTKCKFWIMRQDLADTTPLLYWKEEYTNEPVNWLYGSVPALIGFNQWQSEIVVDPSIYTFDTGGTYAIGTVWYFETDDEVSPNVIADIGVDDTPTGSGPCTPPITGTLSTYVETYDNYIQASPLQRIISRVTFHKDVYEVCAGAFLDTATFSAICSISEFGSGVVEAVYNIDRNNFNVYTSSGPEITVFEDVNTITVELTFRLLEPWALKEMELEWDFGLDIEPVQTLFYQRVVVDDFQENLVTPDLTETNLYYASSGLPIDPADIICPDDTSYTGLIVETVKLPAVDYKQVAMWLDSGGIHHEYDPFVSPILTPTITDGALSLVDENFGDTGGPDDVQYYADNTVTNGKVGMIGFPTPIAGNSKARVIVHMKRPSGRAVVFQSPNNALPNNRVVFTDSLTNDTQYRFKVNSNPAGSDIFDASWAPLTQYDITTFQGVTINAGDYVLIEYVVLPGSYADVVAVFEYEIDTVLAAPPVISINQSGNSTCWDMLLKPFDDVTYSLYPNNGTVNPYFGTRLDAEIVAGTPLTSFPSNTIGITNYIGNGSTGGHFVAANSPYPTSYAIQIDTTIPNTTYVDIAADVKNDYSPFGGNPPCFEYNGIGDYTSIAATANTAFTFDLFGLPINGILGFAGTFRFNKDLSQPQIFFSHSGDNADMFTAMGFRNNEFFIRGWNDFSTLTDNGGINFDANGLNINPAQTYTVVMYLEKVSTGKGFGFEGKCWVNGVEIPSITESLTSALVGPTASNIGPVSELALGNYSTLDFPHHPTNTQLFSVKDMCILDTKPTELEVRRFYNGNRGIYTAAAEYAWEFDTILAPNIVPSTTPLHTDSCLILNNTLPSLTLFF